MAGLVHPPEGIFFDGRPAHRMGGLSPGQLRVSGFGGEIIG
jgi:hypothetical protein